MFLKKVMNIILLHMRMLILLLKSMDATLLLSELVAGVYIAKQLGINGNMNNLLNIA